MTDARQAEDQFYSRYSWCLNSPLSVEDLLRRFREEIDRYEALDGWQREESRTNLYLFVCAVACTVDDHFGRRLNLSTLANRLPQFRGPLAAAQMLVDVSQSIVKMNERTAWHWRRQWDACIARACRLLMCDAESEQEQFDKLRSLSTHLTGVQLPDSLMKRRMRL